MTTIGDGVTTITVDLAGGYQADSVGRNVLHVVIGVAEPAVTLRPAALRSGTLTTAPLSSANADLLVAMLKQAKSFTLTFTGLSSLGMVFVISGKVSKSLPVGSVDTWLVVFDYQEISA